MTTLASDSCCCQRKRLKHFSAPWLGLCSCWRRAKNGPQLSWGQISLHLLTTFIYSTQATQNNIWSFQLCWWDPAQLNHEVLTMNCLSFYRQGHRPSPIPGHYALPKLCRRSSDSKSSRWWAAIRQILNALSRNCSCRWAEVDEDFLHQVVKASPGHLWCVVILRVVRCRARSLAPWS